MTEAAPKVFISYSHDGLEHEERVLILADQLRQDGIDAEIDKYYQSPPEGWPAWCERQIEGADFVLLVCTETYHRRVKGREDPGKGLGAVWEARIIHQLVYESGAVSQKFIPVLFSDGSAEHIPLAVKGWTRYVPDTDEGYEALYRRLTQQPWVKPPPLGVRRRLPSRAPRPRPRDGTSGPAREMVPPSVSRRWADLLNREPQEDAIVERLEAMQRTGRFEPLLVVMPGGASSCHEYFAERVSWRNLRLFVSEDEQPPRYERLKWRHWAVDAFTLLRDLPDRTGARDIKALEARLVGLTQSLCFSFSIDDADWRANRALVRHWIDYFCQSWPAPARGHFVVSFLCVVVPETRGNLSSWVNRLKEMAPGSSLTAYLRELEDRLPSETRLLVTKPLEPIRRKHVMDWIGTIRNLLPDSEQVDDLREKCGRLFPQPAAARSFVDVHSELRAILHKLSETNRVPEVAP
jgi:hypothetical protein